MVLPVPVDRKHLVLGVCKDFRARLETLRAHNYQFPPVGDLTGDVVGEAAVGERNVGAPLEHVDLGRLADPPCLGRGRGATGHSPNNENAPLGFHCLPPAVAQHDAVDDAVAALAPELEAPPPPWRFHGIRAISRASPQ
jgi:hypothetical protein